jgi:hypothetical protein
MKNYSDLSPIERVVTARRLKYSGLAKTHIASLLNISIYKCDVIFNSPQLSSEDIAKKIF